MALMNQYSTITARLPIVPVVATPPVQPPPQPSTSNVTDLPPATAASTAGPSSTVTANVTAESSSSSSRSSEVTDENATASAAATAAASTSNIDDDRVKIEDLGSEEHIDRASTAAALSDEANEIRRRRLQKFLNTEQKND